jgi:hypothetical protein
MDVEFFLHIQIWELYFAFDISLLFTFDTLLPSLNPQKYYLGCKP